MPVHPKPPPTGNGKTVDTTKSKKDKKEKKPKK